MATSLSLWLCLSIFSVGSLVSVRVVRIDENFYVLRLDDERVRFFEAV